METFSFRSILKKSLEALRKLCVSTEFPQQEIKRNFDILRSAKYTAPLLKR